MTAAALPAADEVEITLLGRGVGESCVVHYGNGNWLVVDSFKENGNPAALNYLDALGVTPESVRHLVVTHLDSDHYRGIEQLYDACSGARLWVSAAVRSEWFLKIYGERPKELGVAPVVATISRARRQPLIGTISRLAYLSVGKPLLEEGGVAIRAIAPSEAAVDGANEALARAAGWGTERIRRVLRTDNQCSVALHLRFDGASALLCGDVECQPYECGWRAVLEEPRNAGLMPASLVKVPHHGSEGAHEDQMWQSMVMPEAAMLVAPYWPSGIPQLRDRETAQVRALVAGLAYKRRTGLAKRCWSHGASGRQGGQSHRPAQAR